MAVYGLYIYFTYGDFRRWAGWKDVDARVYLAFGHTVVNGAGIAFCIAMFSRFATLRQVAGALLFAASALFLLVGGGRGPFLGVALAAMVGIATRPPIVGRDRILIPYTFLAAVMLVAIAASYVGYLLLSGHGTTTLDRFTKLANQSENAEMLGTANRFYYWSRAYEFFTLSPVFGNGLRSFSVMITHGAEIDGSHPHNIVLQTLAETGLVGFAFLFLFLFIAMKHASFARLRHDPLFVCVVLFLITSSMSPMFGRDLAGVRKFFFAVSLLALRPPTGTWAQVGPRLSPRVQNRFRWRSVPSLRPAQA
jgi:O-antigen ligase